MDNNTTPLRTGMASEYAEFDGTPMHMFHDGQYDSDAYRTAMNLGLDAAWFHHDTGFNRRFTDQHRIDE